VVDDKSFMAILFELIDLETVCWISFLAPKALCLPSVAFFHAAEVPVVENLGLRVIGSVRQLEAADPGRRANRQKQISTGRGPHRCLPSSVLALRKPLNLPRGDWKITGSISLSGHDSAV
jgi:hypothetical protein